MNDKEKKILKFINEVRKQNGYETFKTLHDFERFRGTKLTEDDRAILLESCKGLEQICQDKMGTEKGKSLRELGVSPVASATDKDIDGSGKTQ